MGFQIFPAHVFQKQVAMSNISQDLCELPSSVLRTEDLAPIRGHTLTRDIISWLPFSLSFPKFITLENTEIFGFTDFPSVFATMDSQAAVCSHSL